LIPCYGACYFPRYEQPSIITVSACIALLGVWMLLSTRQVLLAVLYPCVLYVGQAEGAERQTVALPTPLLQLRVYDQIQPQRTSAGYLLRTRRELDKHTRFP
jgi:hypothetical protein